MKESLHRMFPTFCSWFPKTVGDWIIDVGLIVYIIAEILKTYTPALDPLDPKWGPWLLKTIGDMGLCVAVVAMITVGFRRLRRVGFSFKRLFLPVLGISISLFFAAICFSAYFVSARLEETFDDGEIWIQRLRERASQEDAPLDVRARLGKVYAELSYSSHGERVEYLNEAGDTVRYEPSEQAVAERLENVKAIETFAWVKQTFLHTSFYWSILLFSGLGLGLFTKVKHGD